MLRAASSAWRKAASLPISGRGAPTRTATATCAEPLIDLLLLAPDVRTQAFRQRAGLGRVSVAELIGS